MEVTITLRNGIVTPLSPLRDTYALLLPAKRKPRAYKHEKATRESHNGTDYLQRVPDERSHTAHRSVPLLRGLRPLLAKDHRGGLHPSGEQGQPRGRAERRANQEDIRRGHHQLERGWGRE